MSLRCRLNSVAFHLFLLSSILLSWFPGSILSAVVTLDSMEIFQTHEWLRDKPTVYFQCKEENKTFLPDVKKTHISYTFKGEESWQPLTEFANKKCKRCGFYEQGFLTSDQFDEWEFCPSDFNKLNGRYNCFKDKEFNATFLCSECVPLGNYSNHASASHNGGKGMDWALVATISVLVSVVFILGLAAVCRYWQKRERQQKSSKNKKTGDFKRV